MLFFSCWEFSGVKPACQRNFDLSSCSRYTNKYLVSFSSGIITGSGNFII
ncbi:hypothetical protein [Okeania sp. SIO3B5]|nr:hypothetical protein [Okeania sp. SIO3B5]